MHYNFDALIDRCSSDSDKWSHYEEDVLPLWVADMDFQSPEPVLQALQDRVTHGIFGYPCDAGELRQVLVERMQRLYSWQIDAEDLIFLPGVVTGLNLACHSLYQPGGGVLIQTPVYMPFLRIAANANMQPQSMQLTRLASGQYEVDWDAFEAAFTPETRLFVLCNPHNPVGRVYRREELNRMAEICLKRGVVICSDEIHCDLLFSGQQHTPIASLDNEIAQNTITLMAPSKTFNIAGLQCSFAVIQNKGLRDKFRHATHGLVGWVNLLGMTAGLAAYKYGQEWLDQVLVYLERNRDWLMAYVDQELPGVEMASPEGTYLAWLDCRKVGLPTSPHKFFLEQARVGLNDGATFGEGGEGFVRLNFACPHSVLIQALTQMKASLEALG